MTALDWYFDKIKSHFEHDGDLFETATFTFAIAKQKEKEQIIDAYSNGWHDGQDIIINQVKHVDKGGDDAGLNYLNDTYGK